MNHGLRCQILNLPAYTGEGGGGHRLGEHASSPACTFRCVSSLAQPTPPWQVHHCHSHYLPPCTSVPQQQCHCSTSTPATDLPSHCRILVLGVTPPTKTETNFKIPYVLTVFQALKIRMKPGHYYGGLCKISTKKILQPNITWLYESCHIPYINFCPLWSW